jgi:4,5-DOPA dioxygenase extradiol
MDRKEFILQSLAAGIAGAAGMSTLSAFNKFASALPEQDALMPVLFVGHGSPMNGIEDTEFSRTWKGLAKEIQTPAAVLVVSAHWLTRGTRITAMDFPRTIHDFGGFPKELFDVQYRAPGNPALAKETASLLISTKVELDHDWGLDHGAWTIIRHMYPDAKIPVLQLSIDATKGAQYHYDLSKELYALRKKGVLIMGSGNMVHNLGMVAWDKINESEYGYDWAHKINKATRQSRQKEGTTFSSALDKAFRQMLKDATADSPEESWG